jgi:putative ABC transport system permease protein
MISHYLILAYRTLQKRAVFTIINALGLCLGMTAFVLITQYVTFETSFNSFHDDASTLYRVLNEKVSGEFDSYTAPGFAPMASQKIAGIDQYCRIADGANLGAGVVSCENSNGVVDKSFRENSFVYADDTFFGFFTFPIISGDFHALKNPNTVALSASASRKYFGGNNAIGKIMTLNNQFGNAVYTVGLVYEDMPQYSDLRYDMVFSLQTLYTANLNGNEMWASMDGTGSQWLFTYVKLKPGSDTDLIARQYTEMQHAINSDDENKVRLQPVLEMHLGAGLSDALPTFGSLRFVYVLAGVATLILFIAWFNYINLSTASSLKRAKEVGIRKVTGATRAQLIKQFLGESALLNLFAFALSVVVISLLQVPYSALVGKKMSLTILNYSNSWITAALVFIIGTLASGAYTAFVLSSFNPAKVLKGVFSKSAKGIFIRKFLVVVQFSISLILIASTIILFQQWRYMESKDLGIQADQLMVIRQAEVRQADSFGDHSLAFEDGVRSASFVQSFCRSGNVPTDGFNFSTAGITRQNPMPGDEKINYDMLTIDDRFLETYELLLKAGQNFTTEMCNKGWNQMEYVILNEKAADDLGFASAADAVGEKIKWGTRELIVRGVVKNYHHLSIQYMIGPVIMLPSLKGGYYTLKVSGPDIGKQVSMLEQLYKKNFPGNPFEYHFLDDTFEAKYHTERQYSIIFTLASGLAIFIGCLGLFGLTAYSVEQRTKEIGIRKVLGSSALQIVSLFSKDFVGLVVIAFFIAVPVSWWFMNEWLQGFAYHISIAWWVFGLAGASTLAVAWITVGTQAFRGASSNPVNSLRSE